MPDAIVECGGWKCNEDCVPKSKPCLKPNCTDSNSPCSSSGGEESCKLCYGNLIFNCKTKKCEESSRVKFYCCNGTCINTINPCNGQCPASKPLACNEKCYQGPQDLKVAEKKWVCDGQCLNLTTPCSGNRCPEVNMEVNCRKECELEQTVYKCDGVCQSVDELCRGECGSQSRPWKCPTNNQTCVSNSFCSIYGITSPEFEGEVEKCPYVKDHFKETCERPEGLKNIKCKDSKVACTGHRKQCIEKSDLCDGVLNCMDRSDESGCKTISKDFEPKMFIACNVSISNNYNNLGKVGNSGFECGKDICLDQSLWCGYVSRKPVWIDDTLKKKCGDILDHVRNGRLCSNQTFWNSVKCSDPSATYRFQRKSRICRVDSAIKK